MPAGSCERLNRCRGEVLWPWTLCIQSGIYEVTKAEPALPLEIIPFFFFFFLCVCVCVCVCVFLLFILLLVHLCVTFKADMFPTLKI